MRLAIRANLMFKVTCVILSGFTFLRTLFQQYEQSLRAKGSGEIKDFYFIKPDVSLMSLNPAWDAVEVCDCRQDNVKQGESLAKSLCGTHATSLGPGQKIISFSLYNNIDQFISGIMLNHKIMNKIYPGYTMRIYHNIDNSRPDQVARLCKIKCLAPKLFLCNVRSLGDLGESFGMLWRFTPMADPLVSEWHSRDLDSLISAREAAAVNDWLENTNTSYHLMRDNPYHNAKIMGGMFGMRLHEGNRAKMKTVFERIIDQGKDFGGKGVDQILLKDHLWPEIATNVTVHDSYLCRTWPRPIWRPFPTRRLSSPDFMTAEPFNFVGSNGGSISLKSHYPCPENCRPQKHMDWILC